MLTSLTNQPFLFALLGGLGLFLFGMKLMAEGLQRVAGARLRHILNALTVNRLLGLLVGMGMTTLVQSSTVTTVMVVGFVNAGLISLVQAIGVVLGTSLGTTLTAQLMAFQVWHFGLPLIGVGAALRFFGRDRRLQDCGEIVLGAGLVFFSLFLLKGACEPLRGNPELLQVLTHVDDNPLLGVVIGALMTILVQSGSASIGLTIALAGSGLLSFEASAALILGESLGTTLTVNLTALGSSLAARRTALAHLLFSGVGVCAMLLLFPWFTATVNALTPGEPEFVIQSTEQLEVFGGSLGDKPYIARHIANAHTLLHLCTALLFLPLVGQLARLTARLISGSDEPRDFHLNYLDPRVMNTPPIALAQARVEVQRMAVLTGEVVAETLLLIGDQRRERFAALQGKEELIDRLQREITDFLVTLTQQSVTVETSREVAALIHMVNDLERVGDHCASLGLLVERKLDQQIVFSEVARRELADMSRLVGDFHDLVAEALKQKGGGTLGAARQLEDAIDRSEELLRNNHIRRLNTGECTVVSGLIFIDMLHHLEKIGDHCFNVIRALCELEAATSGSGRSGEEGAPEAS